MTQARGFFKTLNYVTEETYGTTPAISSGEMIKLPFNSFEMGSDEEMIEPGTIRGSRYQAEPSFGNISVQGRGTIPLDVRNIGYWLKLLMGNPNTTGSGTYTHTFNPATMLPSASFEIGFSDISSYHVFTGCKVNSMAFSFQKSTELTADVEILGKSETAPSGSSIAVSPTSLVFDRFNAKGVSLQKGGIAITTIRKLDFSIRNELATDIFCIDGTGFRNSLPETNFIVDGSFEVLFENQDIYNEAINGTETSLQVTCTNGTNSLVFNIYEIKFPRRSLSSSASAPVFMEVPFKAYYQDNAQAVPIRITLTNNTASYT